MQHLLPALRRVRLRLQAVPFEGNNPPLPEENDILVPFRSASIREFSLDITRTTFWGLSFSDSESFLSALHRVLNWASLTDLSLHQYSGTFQWLLDTLRKCQQVKTLFLSYEPVYSLEIPSSGLTTLPKLTKFKLRYGQDDEKNICGFLEAPMLTHFSFESTKFISSSDMNDVFRSPSSSEPRFRALQSFLLRCTNLKSLTLRPLYLSVRDMISIFETVPQIEHMVFDDTPPGYNPDILGRGGGPSTFPFSEFRHQLGPLLQARNSNHPRGTNSVSYPLLPNIHSLSIIYIYIDPLLAERIMEICKHRLPCTSSGRPAASEDDNTAISESSSYAPLKRIKITGSKLDSTVAIEDEVTRYAELVGIKIGKDLDLDISYPWGTAMEEEDLPPTPTLEPGDGFSILQTSFTA
ncbi:hypothetical protein CVT24_005614 [Panaeolus cyanescens]|uniref:F-box domain-containing protein n=1 Tax=Panaeolus cyanescens TaxID=181874 RepID=A0A409YXZ4_9AGAR|nr:hypothetical protein CVT24_005614 [Panaeolus cyanescens]